jgi:hypothetical protein
MSREVFDFIRRGPLSIDDANQVVGILNRVTDKHRKTVNSLLARLEALSPTDREKTSVIESEINCEIEDWNVKVRKLGAIPKGLWLVDIDAGDGYYCWKFPEPDVAYWHSYQCGFTGRIPLIEKNNAHRSRSDQLSSR